MVFIVMIADVTTKDRAVWTYSRFPVNLVISISAKLVTIIIVTIKINEKSRILLYPSDEKISVEFWFINTLENRVPIDIK